MQEGVLQLGEGQDEHGHRRSTKTFLGTAPKKDRLLEAFKFVGNIVISDRRFLTVINVKSVIECERSISYINHTPPPLHQ